MRSPDDLSDPPLYLSLRVLLDKLFGAIISLQDEAFVRTFFMTYRRFCKPADVMQEFLDRFNEVSRPGVSKDVQMWAQQKCVLSSLIEELLPANGTG